MLNKNLPTPSVPLPVPLEKKARAMPTTSASRAFFEFPMNFDCGDQGSGVENI
jgi:hypothetical protein